MNAMEACILENEERQVRVAEIGGERYVEDVRGRFVPEALYQAQVREIGTGVTLVNGRDFMTDASARLVPLDMVKPQHKLEDEVVRKVIAFAFDLSAQIGRFLEHTMIDLDGFDALLAQEYEVIKGGKKGNRTYQSYDGLLKVQVQVAERIDFGPELQIAKGLIDECLSTDMRKAIKEPADEHFDAMSAGGHRPPARRASRLCRQGLGKLRPARHSIHRPHQSKLGRLPQPSGAAHWRAILHQGRQIPVPGTRHSRPGHHPQSRMQRLAILDRAASDLQPDKSRLV